MNCARIALLVLLISHTACSRPSSAQQTAPARDTSRPTVGAIRWDGWTGGRGAAGETVQKTLGPTKWHYRLPFYAKVVGDDKVKIDGTPQAIMNREIEYAAAAGLDYWAFVTYADDDPLSLAIERYLTSPIRSKINFCLITECGRWPAQTYVNRVVRLMQEPGYQRVLDNRPLLYLGFIEPNKLKHFAEGADGLRKALDAFRSTVAAKGLPRPYIVIMDFHPEEGRKWADALGCDAISSYATGWAYGRTPYARWAANTEAFWEQCRKTGAHVVPIVMTGWDPRPRVDTPTPWGNPYASHAGEVDRSEPAAPAEIANHLGNALRWLAAHSDAAPAQTAIIYAWNEFDEGGWLCPTLSEGPARLDAISKLLRPSRLACTSAASPDTAPARP